LVRFRAEFLLADLRIVSQHQSLRQGLSDNSRRFLLRTGQPLRGVGAAASFRIGAG